MCFYIFSICICFVKSAASINFQVTKQLQLEERTCHVVNNTLHPPSYFQFL